MTGRLELIETDSPAAWLRRLEDVRHDFYHLPQYHRLAEHQGEGKAVLFAFEEGEYRIALPLLLRSVDAVEGLEAAASGLLDATSVYGYSGPLASHGTLPRAFVESFQAALGEALRQMRVVSLFSRLHPLLPNFDCIRGLGELRGQGRTISIDLTKPDEEQFLGFRSNHRRNIRKLRQEEYRCEIDESPSALKEFTSLYHQTMARVDADRWYFFDFDYFQRLLEIDGLVLMACRRDDILVAGAILSNVGDIAQYHLGGTSNEWLKAAPMKLVFDEARRWAGAKGCSVLHLGGGLGSREDALYHFKAGFSDRLHDFFTWRWIVDPETYEQLDAERSRVMPSRAETRSSDFFPIYRS